jgi:hypothetical protein
MSTFLGALKSKTIWFAILLALFGALMDNSTYLQNIIPEQYFSYVMMVIGIIVAGLRLATTTSLSNK